MTREERVGEVKSLARSFRNAFRGIAFCIQNERNMRIHLTVGAYVLVFSPFFYLTAAEYAVLIVVITLVLVTETVNTAIEAAVNMQAQWYDSIARVAKDVAAGAVLLCALSAVVIGCILFLRPAVLLRIFFFLTDNLFCGALFVISLPLAVLFIFRRPRFRRLHM